MENKNVVYTNNKITGGHYAFQNPGKNPFCNPMKECTSIELFADDVVADIGAYVGEYTMYAANQGVKRIKSYEATPNTFNLLQKNVSLIESSANIDIHNLAVVGDDRKECELFLSKGIGVTNSIEKRRGKKGFIKIDTIRYEQAVKDCTVVKIDVEGAEYSYDIIQPNLRAIILEFHPLVNKDWQGKAYMIMEKLKSNGFKSIIYPTFKNGWSLNSSWIR
tara:strand:- start:936 stop:1595 length:660 start_codon:yes stop_codon:yes gene_type:complete